MNTIKRILPILLAINILLFSSCQKEDISPLTGTAWECLEDPEIIVFSDNHSGIYYVKSATDGVYDEVYSSFDFTYEVSGKNINVHVFFSKFGSPGQKVG